MHSLYRREATAGCETDELLHEFVQEHRGKNFCKFVLQKKCAKLKLLRLKLHSYKTQDALLHYSSSEEESVDFIAVTERRW